MIDYINKWMAETSLFQNFKIIYVGGLSSEDKPDSPSLVRKLYSVMLPSVGAEVVTCSMEKPPVVQAISSVRAKLSLSVGRETPQNFNQEHSTLLDSSSLSHQ